MPNAAIGAWRRPVLHHVSNVAIKQQHRRNAMNWDQFVTLFWTSRARLVKIDAIGAFRPQMIA
ncbi:hypothetical protein QP162_11340 [Sphingomonas aurantiaca]|uniref:hypothetical protein n=1 Tax=Sphingomonas aurantiaca TaxID=185949 RepID=UPI002FE2B789